MSHHPASQSLRRRSSRSLPATLTALVLLAVALGAGYAAITRIVSGTWPDALRVLREGLTSLTWNAPAVWVAAIIVTLLGLILLFAALLPGPHSSVRLNEPAVRRAEHSEAVITRRGLSRLAEAHVARTDGVDKSSVKTTAKALDVRVRTPLHDAGDLADRLKASLDRKLQDLGVTPMPKITVRVSTTRD